LVVRQSISPGTEITTSTPVTITAGDSLGNLQTGLVTLHLIDDIPPEITCPVDQVLERNSVLPDYSVMAPLIDNCENTVVISQAPPPGSPVSGPLEVVLTATDSSGNFSTCSFPVSIITGLEETRNNHPIVYPNPFKNFLHIQEGEGFRLRVYDARGKIHLDKVLVQSHSIIDVGGLVTGTYFLSLKNNKAALILKVIKR
ncbi:MAG: T9SS type A sorting domain-containing protein, partial [Cyclobacteriaceae bacterium]|nr:T9SS type A sorting domain-containing protein [Cyclobacteriaceae bacterium]